MFTKTHPMRDLTEKQVLIKKIAREKNMKKNYHTFIPYSSIFSSSKNIEIYMALFRIQRVIATPQKLKIGYVINLNKPYIDT